MNKILDKVGIFIRKLYYDKLSLPAIFFRVLYKFFAISCLKFNGNFVKKYEKNRKIFANLKDRCEIQIFMA